MELEPLRHYLLQKKGSIEYYPFGPEPAVFKVMDKMFALLSWPTLSLKCDPDFALALRDKYKAVQPGYHLSKKHWNTITFDDTMPDNEILGLIDISYNLVVKGLTKVERQRLNSET